MTTTVTLTRLGEGLQEEEAAREQNARAEETTGAAAVSQFHRMRKKWETHCRHNLNRVVHRSSPTQSVLGKL